MDFKEIKKAIQESSKESIVYIGCDSGQRRKRKNEWHTKWALVVCLHVDGCHGGKYWHEIRTETNKHRMELRERLLKEVEYSVELALLINKFVGERRMEVHCDINSDRYAKSNVLLGTAKGWVEGQNFTFKPKPVAFAATYVADYVLHKHWPKAGFRK